MTRTEGEELDWQSYGLSFANRLRWLREHRNLTQEELAHLSGMHRNQVCNLERNVSRDEGCADPHLSTVFVLARALRVPPEMLVPDGSAQVQRLSRETANDLSWAKVEIEMTRRLTFDAPPEVDK